MIRWGIVTPTAVLACACALSAGRRDPPPANLHRVTHVVLDVVTMGQRTPYSVEHRARRLGVLAEAFVRRGFVVIDNARDADAAFSANLDSVIVLDAPRGPRYYFSFELTSASLGLTWEATFDTLNYWAPSQAEEQGIAQGVDRLFSDWKKSAVRAGVMTNTEARRLRRIPAVTPWARQRPSAASVPGYGFPWATDLGCPNQACSFGHWLACATVDVRDAPGSVESVTWRLSRGERFEAWAGILLTLEPGEVRVTREFRQDKGVAQRVYRAGDTLHLLGHLAGQRFAAIHNGRPVTVDLFWPSKTGAGHPIAGALVRADVSQRWMLAVQGERSGWILQNADVRPANGIGDALACPAR